MLVQSKIDMLTQLQETVMMLDSVSAKTIAQHEPHDQDSVACASLCTAAISAACQKLT